MIHKLLSLKDIILNIKDSISQPVDRKIVYPFFVITLWVVLLELMAHLVGGPFAFLAGQLWFLMGWIYSIAALVYLVKNSIEESKNNNLMGMITPVLFIVPVLCLTIFGTLDSEIFRQVGSGLKTAYLPNFGYNFHGFLGAGVKQDLLTAMPTFMFGRSGFFLNLGYTMPILGGCIFFYTGFKKFLEKKYDNSGFLSGLTTLILLVITFFAPFNIVSPTVLLPFWFTINVLGCLFLLSDKVSIIRTVLLMWAGSLLGSTFISGLSSLFFLLAGLGVIIALMQLKKNVPFFSSQNSRKHHMMALLAGGIYSTGFALISILSRQDLALENINPGVSIITLIPILLPVIISAWVLTQKTKGRHDTQPAISDSAKKALPALLGAVALVLVFISPSVDSSSGIKTNIIDDMIMTTVEKALPDNSEFAIIYLTKDKNMISMRNYLTYFFPQAKSIIHFENENFPTGLNLEQPIMIYADNSTQIPETYLELVQRPSADRVELTVNGGIMAIEKLYIPPSGINFRNSTIPLTGNAVPVDEFNLDFETPAGSSVAGWNTSIQPTSKITFDSQIYFSGGSSVRFDASTPDDAILYRQVRVTENTRYIATAWIKTKDLKSGIDNGYGPTLNIKLPDNTYFYFLDFPLGTNDWQQVQFTFETPKDVTSVEVQCRLGWFGNPCSGTAWFDLIEIRESY